MLASDPVAGVTADRGPLCRCGRGGPLDPELQTQNSINSQAPLPGARLTWHAVWGTDAEDHLKEPVLALAFAESLEGLPGGDAGHAGWLISSSRGILNLWECTPGSASGDPALMVRWP